MITTNLWRLAHDTAGPPYRAHRAEHRNCWLVVDRKGAPAVVAPGGNALVSRDGAQWLAEAANRGALPHG